MPYEAIRGAQRTPHTLFHLMITPFPKLQAIHSLTHRHMRMATLCFADKVDSNKPTDRTTTNQSFSDFSFSFSLYLVRLIRALKFFIRIAADHASHTEKKTQKRI